MKAELIADNTSQTLKNIEALIEEIKKGHSGERRTSGILEINDIRIDVNNPDNMQDLIIAFSVIELREQSYNKSAEALGLTEYPALETCGATAEQWKNDIRNATILLKSKKELEELEAIAAELRECITKEDRKNNALDRLNNLGKTMDALPMGE